MEFSRPPFDWRVIAGVSLGAGLAFIWYFNRLRQYETSVSSSSRSPSLTSPHPRIDELERRVFDAISHAVTEKLTKVVLDAKGIEVRFARQFSPNTSR